MSERDVPYTTVDKFDKAMAGLLGLPDVFSTEVSTIIETASWFGTQTIILQSVRQIERDGESSKSRDTLFLQCIDESGCKRLVIPHKAIAAILRQHDALTSKIRKRLSKQQAQARKARGELPGFMRNPGKRRKKTANVKRKARRQDTSSDPDQP